MVDGGGERVRKRERGVEEGHKERVVEGKVGWTPMVQMRSRSMSHALLSNRERCCLFHRPPVAGTRAPSERVRGGVDGGVERGRKGERALMFNRRSEEWRARSVETRCHR